MRRAQTAIEFVILVGFMLFVFTAFFLVIQERSSVIKQEIYRRDLDSVAKIINNEISLAQQVRFGYVRDFTLPALLSGEPYNVTLSSGSELTIRRQVSDDEYVVFLPTKVYITTLGNNCYDSSGEMIPGTTYHITKLNLDGNDSVGLYVYTTGLICP